MLSIFDEAILRKETPPEVDELLPINWDTLVVVVVRRVYVKEHDGTEMTVVLVLSTTTWFGYDDRFEDWETTTVAVVDFLRESDKAYCHLLRASPRTPCTALLR
jgi:hypothetical protein